MPTTHAHNILTAPRQVEVSLAKAAPLSPVTLAETWSVGAQGGGGGGWGGGSGGEGNQVLSGQRSTSQLYKWSWDNLARRIGIGFGQVRPPM